MKILSLRFVMLFSGVLVSAACQLPPDESRYLAAYVGVLDGTDVAVGLVSGGDGVIMYSGGGERTLATHTRWFTENPTRDAARFEASTDGWHTTGTLSIDTAVGTMSSPNGTKWTWTASRTADDTIAGLYSAVENDCRTGVIVRQKHPDKRPLTQGAWCDGTGQYAEVTPVTPAVLTADHRLEVEVVVDGMPRRFFVSPFQQ